MIVVLMAMPMAYVPETASAESCFVIQHELTCYDEETETCVVLNTDFTCVEPECDDPPFCEDICVEDACMGQDESCFYTYVGFESIFENCEYESGCADTWIVGEKVRSCDPGQNPLAIPEDPLCGQYSMVVFVCIDVSTTREPTSYVAVEPQSTGVHVAGYVDQYRFAGSLILPCVVIEDPAVPNACALAGTFVSRFATLVDQDALTVSTTTRTIFTCDVTVSLLVPNAGGFGADEFPLLVPC